MSEPCLGAINWMAQAIDALVEGSKQGGLSNDDCIGAMLIAIRPLIEQVEDGKKYMLPAKCKACGSVYCFNRECTLDDEAKPKRRPAKTSTNVPGLSSIEFDFKDDCVLTLEFFDKQARNDFVLSIVPLMAKNLRKRKVRDE